MKSEKISLVIKYHEDRHLLTKDNKTFQHMNKCKNIQIWKMNDETKFLDIKE